jgi:hypothetical protein
MNNGSERVQSVEKQCGEKGTNSYSTGEETEIQ